jgi:hypothetical protein
MKYYLGLCVALAAGCGGDDSGPTAFDHGIPDLSAPQDLEGDDGGPDLAFNPGPVITIDKPMVGEIVGGTRLTIQATIKDPVGILPASVQAEFGGNNMYTATLVPGAATDTWVGMFDLSKLGTQFVYVNLSVQATDKQGLTSNTAIQVTIDNTPPKLSLTPPKLYYSKTAQLTDGTNGNLCSQPFNPVGENQPADGAIVPQIFWLRALVMDRGNFATGLTIEQFSGIDPTSVEIVAMPAPAGAPPLIVHTAGYAPDLTPTQCDDVNPVLLPMGGADMAKASSVVTVALGQVPLQGAPDYSPPVTFAGDSGTVPTGCDQIGDPNGTKPGALCAADSKFFFVLPVYAAPTSGIWSIPTISTMDGLHCVGTQFDSLNQLADGPACIVVRARDAVGNHGVSAVLHVCINRSGTACTGWNPNDSTTWPNCTGTYDPSTNTTTSTACTPWTFENDLVFPNNQGR